MRRQTEHLGERIADPVNKLCSHREIRRNARKIRAALRRHVFARTDGKLLPVDVRRIILIGKHHKQRAVLALGTDRTDQTRFGIVIQPGDCKESLRSDSLQRLCGGKIVYRLLREKPGKGIGALDTLTRRFLRCRCLFRLHGRFSADGNAPGQQCRCTEHRAQYTGNRFFEHLNHSFSENLCCPVISAENITACKLYHFSVAFVNHSGKSACKIGIFFVWMHIQIIFFVKNRKGTAYRHRMRFPPICPDIYFFR